VHFQHARTLRGWAGAMLHSRTHDLKYYLAFARAGSMPAAAKALGVSQSTVQHRLTEFEDRLGRRLVTRHLSVQRYSYVRHFKLQAQKILCLLFKLFSVAAVGQGRKHDHETTVDLL
jgi:hypothetical protein